LIEKVRVRETLKEDLIELSILSNYQISKKNMMIFIKLFKKNSNKKFKN